MFGLGFSEIIVVLAVTVIFVGPDKLPELAQKLGRFIWQVKHTSEEFRKEIALPDLHNDLKEEAQSIKRELNNISSEIQASLEEKPKNIPKIELNKTSKNNSDKESETNTEKLQGNKK